MMFKKSLVIGVAILTSLTSFAWQGKSHGQHAGHRKLIKRDKSHRPSGVHATRHEGNYYIVLNADTYRIGAHQYATATLTVREQSKPDDLVGIDVGSCQIIAPVAGSKQPCRRQNSCTCKADWAIPSDSDKAMKDFDVDAYASGQSMGDLHFKATFKYREMH
jgi:hypothetical protein